MATTDNPTQRSAMEELEKQVLTIMEGIQKNPDKRKQILIGYITHIYETVKETIHKNGAVIPHYVVLANPPAFGGPTVTEEVIEKAKKAKAEAVVSVEGFESSDDITDIIYHVSMSAPALGVLGWVLKAKLDDGSANIIKEKPYLFDSQDKVKTLGELVEELEAEDT